MVFNHHGHFDKALRYFEADLELIKELYEFNSKNVEFKNSLAISYAKLGVFYRNVRNDKNKAYSYFQEAKLLWKYLLREFPTNIEFKRYWKQINISLDDL